VGIEGFVVAQDAPRDTGELVGQRDGELVPVQSLRVVAGVILPRSAV
jgi:hypothetical protein